MKSFVDIIISNVLLELIKTIFFKKINFKSSFPPEKYICSSLYFQINTINFFLGKELMYQTKISKTKQRQFIYRSLYPLKKSIEAQDVLGHNK